MPKLPSASDQADTSVIQEFIFSVPLYSRRQITEDQLNGLLGDPNFEERMIDGYCLGCKRQSTFRLISKVNEQQRYRISHTLTSDAYQHFDEVALVCSRNELHHIRTYLFFIGLSVAKVGQFPSLADLANSELQQTFKHVLTQANRSELYKAVGLAAHGEGIGAFVYLRRIFERLLKARFAEFKDIEGWKEAEFDQRRFDEKIEMLSGHLPDFLVENKRIYKILSAGVHELENDACLSFFDVGMRTIVMILEEDEKKRHDLDTKKQLTAAVAAFEANKKPRS